MNSPLTLEPEAKTKQEVVTHDHAPDSLGDRLHLSIEILDAMDRIRKYLTGGKSCLVLAGVVTGGLNRYRLDHIDKDRVETLAELADDVSKFAERLAENIRSHARAE